MSTHAEEFQRRRTEKRRLAILYYLMEEPDRLMSVSLMQMALESNLQAVASDVLIADAELLGKAGLLTMEHIGSLPALKLTTWGAEVVKGTRTVPGVQKPPLE